MKDFIFIMFVLQLLMLAGTLAGIVILNIRLYEIEYWLDRIKAKLYRWEGKE